MSRIAYTKTDAAPAAPRVSAHSTAIIPQDCVLQGDITIGQGVIIHPKASVLATNGPIIIGDDCIVEEMAVIINSSKEPMRIGRRNHFMVSCQAVSIGDDNTFHPRSAVSGINISNKCNIAAGSILIASSGVAQVETLPERTVVFGDAAERALWDGTGESAEKAVVDGQREYLREILSKYNRMRAV